LAAADQGRIVRREAALIALTAGEPAGIGPDLCLAAACMPRRWPLVCIADRDLLRARADRLGLAVEFSDYRRGQEVAVSGGTLCVLHLPLPAACVPGRLDVRNARQVLAWIDRGVDGCISGEFDAVVTAPVQKSLISQSGVKFSGHTEYIAERTHAPLPVMLLTAANMRVALATTHLPLRAVSDALSIGVLTRILKIMSHDLRRFWGLPQPRIGVCGLNPHAGEDGLLGDEEQRVIGPAIAQARAEGLRVDGPFPADTLFVPRHLAPYDAVLAMYHDQGLPVLKHAGFGHAVNVTLGLPIVRTSVDHGTALDLAASGKADAGSLVAAIELAAHMASCEETA
jgi:4-hydroxythreonine-4-phosphate dehydrogenase